MIEEDKPTFWEKLLAFVVTCVAVAGVVTLVQIGFAGLLRICK